MVYLNFCKDKQPRATFACHKVVLQSLVHFPHDALHSESGFKE